MVRNQLILDFLTVPESLRAMLMRRKPNDSGGDGSGGMGSGGLNGHSGGHRKSDSYSFSSSEEEREVNLLLKELSLQKNRVRALGKFEKWYFEKATAKKEPPNMRPDLIKKLYTGDETHQGLVHSCRLLHSKVAWRASISLLVRLLDIERNKYARIFQEVFLTLQQGLYKEMYLHQHINETSQEDGFKIVQLIKNNLPQLEHKFYVPDESAWKQFEKWEKIQKDSFGVSGDGLNGRRNEWFEDNNDKSSRLAYNWKEMEYKEISENIFSLFRELSTESDLEYQKVHTVKNHDLKVRYKKDPFTQQWKLKITFAVNHPPKLVYSFLKNQMINKSWNSKQSDMSWNTKIVEQSLNKKLDNFHYIIHQTYKSFNSPYKFSDFILLTCLKSDIKSKRYHLLFSSISNYDDEVSDNNTSRAVLLPSGFEIRPTKDNINKSHVSYRAHMTNESVLTVSADLLGETNELFESMSRIEQLISAQNVKY